MNKFINPCDTMNAMIEQLRIDINRLQRKANSYHNLWSYLGQLEEYYDDLIPDYKWDRLYSLWAKVADRCSEYEQAASNLQTYADSLAYTLDDIQDEYSFLKDYTKR